MAAAAEAERGTRMVIMVLVAVVVQDKWAPVVVRGVQDQRDITAETVQIQLMGIRAAVVVEWGVSAKLLRQM